MPPSICRILYLLPCRFLFWLARDRAPGFLTGWLAGVAYFAVTLNWITSPFMVDAANHAWMAPFALVFMAGGLALFWGVAFWLTARLNAGALGLIGAWTLAEYARSTILTGFPWALIAYIWEDTPILQAAAFLGPHGLGMLTLLVFGLPAMMRRWQLGAGAAALIVVAAVVGTLARTPDEVAFTDKSLRLIQPNAPQHQKWDPAYQQIFFDRQIDLTRAGTGADLVIWPEAAVPYPIHERPQLNSYVAAAAGPTSRVILGALHRKETPDGSTVLNTLAALDAEGAVGALYAKHHLVPFGEYLPFPGFFDRLGLRAIAQAAGRMEAGPGPELVRLDGIPPFQPLICYEAIFPHEVLTGENRPAWFLQITNDAWFGTFSGPYQHLTQARFRAVEQGLPLVRAANTGVSAVIDPYGQLVAFLELGEAGAVDALLPAALQPTVYARSGDWPWIAVSLALLIGTVAHTRRDTHHKPRRV